MKGGAADPETQDGLGGSGEMFLLGQAAMMYAQCRFPGGLDEVDFEWEIRGIPTYAGMRPNNFVAIECYGVPASGSNLKEAGRFRYLSHGN